jgi:hypothetical protein
MVRSAMVAVLVPCVVAEKNGRKASDAAVESSAISMRMALSPASWLICFVLAFAGC